MSIIPMFTPYLASYSLSNLNLETTVSAPRGEAGPSKSLLWKPDGTRLYFAEDSRDDIFYADASTAWDLDTIGSWTEASPTGYDDVGICLQFNDDGTKMFIGSGQTEGASGSPRLEEFALSTPYDMTTATGPTLLQAPSGEGDSGESTNFFLTNYGSTVVFVVESVFKTATLSTPWDLSTAGSWSASVLDLSGVASTHNNAAIQRLNTQFTFIPFDGTTIYDYRFSGGDISTATQRNSFDVGTEVMGCTFGDSGRKFYVATSSEIYQYSVG